MTTRRYDDDEVRAIFALATTGGETQEQSLPAEPGGLTLAELQRIGEEAGIEPARVADAAAHLERRAQPAVVRRTLGMPIGVSRVVPLPRAPTDREWEQTVAQFRTTFGAHGRAMTTGGLREWSNGNLHVTVEPTESGEQLRLTTRNEGAMALNLAGSVVGGMALFVSAISLSAGKPDKALAMLGILGTVSLAIFGINLLRVPRWARERDRQMAELADRTVRLLSGPTGDADGTTRRR